MFNILPNGGFPWALARIISEGHFLGVCTLAKDTNAVTPMMAQFLEIKADYPDALLFYRMGDFYEMFFEDSVLAAEALDIALTKRGKHQGKDIPMCGVPARAAETYLLALIRKGFRVAVCDQLEDPAEAKKRGHKAVVKRGVVRLVTPGTLTEDSLLDARQHNFLCAYGEVRDETAVAWIDISTGDFFVQPCAKAAISPLLSRLMPKEILTGNQIDTWLSESIADIGISRTELAPASFDSTAAQLRLCKLFQVKSLDAFGSFSRPELAAMGAIVDYLEITQKGKLPLVRPPVQESQGSGMSIDAASRRNLEITRTISGERKNSLLGVVDCTITGAGARLLETRMNNPSTDLHVIQSRLDDVQFFTQNGGVKDQVRELLKQVPEIDRALTRLSLDRGGPRDMVAIREGLQHAKTIADILTSADLSIGLTEAAEHMKNHEPFCEMLQTSLKNDPPLLAREGEFVAEGLNSELDEMRLLRDQGRSVISSLQKKYMEQVGISSLKVKHNNVLGYFIETPATHADKMLGAEYADIFIHRQTTANAVRFTTLELSDLETKILNAGARALQIEKEIYEKLREKIIAYANEISFAARALASVDLQTALADLSIKLNWVRPKMSADRRFNIIGGRHPVVENALAKEGSHPFVANDCDLSCDSEEAKRLWLLTGPNMAGKSTFLRQNALIAVLAQMGSFVPAEKAEIGIVSQLFSRVGASDDLARGRSTFMVEMVETAAILNQADQNALVILDEIGRGTATYDGLSIAWATLEHLHAVNQCRTLFATHYHELTRLSSKLEGLMNATITVREWEGDIIFLHEIKLGAADRSYGVQVAKLAGLPESVVQRAKVVLEALEEGSREAGGKSQAVFEDLPLFAAAPPPQQVPQATPPVVDALAEIMPDELTPKDALAKLYELKAMLDL
jgi:DNA mismatch repair protein MutS